MSRFHIPCLTSESSVTFHVKTSILSCFPSPEVWSWSLAPALTLCHWDGVVQYFPMTPRFMTVKRGHKKGKGQMICFVRRWTTFRFQVVFRFADCTWLPTMTVFTGQCITAGSCPFPGHAMRRRIPMLSLTCFMWMGVISWELNFIRYPALPWFLLPKRDWSHWFVWKVYVHVEHFRHIDLP